MTIKYTIAWTYPDGSDGKLGDDQDFHQRQFYDSLKEAESQVAFIKDIHRDWRDLRVVTVNVD